MNRILPIPTAFLTVAVLLCGVVFFPAAATAVSIDFTTMTPFGNKGNSVVVNSDLTLFARTHIPDGDSSLTGGMPGTIFIGKLGSQGAGNVFNCPDPKKKNCGVGVQNSNTGGSKGISGEGGDQDESLIFDFASPGVIGSSAIVHLIGLNGLNITADSDNNNDVISLMIDYFDAPDQVFASVNSSIISSGSLGTLNFSALSLSGSMIDQFAVRASEGHFGVTAIDYTTQVPEPSTLLLLGAGLAGIGIFRKRIKRAHS